MRLCTIPRSGAISWCPITSNPTISSSPLLACGSVAGTLDDFGTSATLEIYSILPKESLVEGSNNSPTISTTEQQEGTIEQTTSTSHDEDDFFSESSTSPFFSTLVNEPTHHHHSTSSSTLTSDFVLLGKIQVPDRFNRLSWGMPNSLENFPLGVLAGSQTDGSISLYNVKKIVKSSYLNALIGGNEVENNKEEALIANLDKHVGAVRGLEFNPKQNNLLASAGEDGQLYIWNLKQPDQPAAVVLGGKNPHQNQTISHLQWNRKYEYILATTSHQGTSVVWDLKQKRVLVPFSNTSHPRTKYSSLAWNPDQHTQLVIASEEDDRPVIELWDLRKAYAPIKELGLSGNGHKKGILSVNWCPDDSNLLVSSGKDGRTLIWNPNNGELLGELSSNEGMNFSNIKRESQNWVFDVQWAPKSTILSTCSFDKKINIFSVQDAAPQVIPTDEMMNTVSKGANVTANNNAYKTAPKWLKRTVGVSWAFGNQLIRFNNICKQVEEVSQELTTNVNVVLPQPIQVYSLPSLTQDDNVTAFNKEMTDLEKIIVDQRGNAALDFCKHKIEEEKQNEEKKEDSSEWRLLEILFTANDREKGEKLRALLGFDKNKIDAAVKKLTESTKEDNKTVEVIRNESEDMNNLIKNCLMIGNYESAVQCCVEANRFADALLLSQLSGSQDILQRTVENYFQSEEGKYLNQWKNILHRNYDAIATSDSSLNSWKEKVAMLSLDLNRNKDLIENLLKELTNPKEGEDVSVISKSEDRTGRHLCYILTGQTDQCIIDWIKEFENKEKEMTVTNNTEYAMLLLELISKIELLQQYYHQNRRHQSSALLQNLLQNGAPLHQYYITFIMKCIELGTNQQQSFAVALHYLNIIVGNNENVEGIVLPKEYEKVNLLELRFRIYYALARPFGNKPVFPFKPKVTKQVAPQVNVSTTSTTGSYPVSTPVNTTSTSHVNEDKLKKTQKKREVQLLPQPQPKISSFTGTPVNPNTIVNPPPPSLSPSTNVTTTTTSNTNTVFTQPTTFGNQGTFGGNTMPSSTASNMWGNTTIAGGNMGTMMGSNTSSASSGMGVDNTWGSNVMSHTSNTMMNTTPAWSSLPTNDNIPPNTFVTNTSPQMGTNSPSSTMSSKEKEKYREIDIDRSITGGNNQQIINNLTLAFDRIYGGEDGGEKFLERKRMIAQSITVLFKLAAGNINSNLANDLLEFSTQLKDNKLTEAEHTLKEMQKVYFSELKQALGIRFLIISLKSLGH
ncbi:hypothetical protein ABK040_010876 [Willaertia magna]